MSEPTRHLRDVSAPRSWYDADDPAASRYATWLNDGDDRLHDNGGPTGHRVSWRSAAEVGEPPPISCPRCGSYSFSIRVIWR